MDEVVQLGGELDARGAPADDGEVQEAALGDVVAGQGGARRALFEEGEHAQADAARVADVAQEVRVLPDAFDAEGLAVGADSDDKLVVGHVGHGALGWWGDLRPTTTVRFGTYCSCYSFFTSTAAILLLLSLNNLLLGRREDGLAREVVRPVLLDADDLAGKVHVVSPALVELDATAAAQAPDRLEGRAELKGPDGGGRQEGREDEVGAGRDDDALVLCGIEGAGEGVPAQPRERVRPLLLIWVGVTYIPDPRITTRSFLPGMNVRRITSGIL